MVNIKKIVDVFNKNYETLYNLNTDILNGYDDIVESGLYYIEKRPDIYKLFVQYRQDVLSSDREFAAYGLTLYDLNLIYLI